MAWRQIWRPFCYAFLLTLCVLGLVFSCVVIEYNTQRVRAGTADFGIQYTLEGGRLQVMLDGQCVTPTDMRLAGAVLPPPVRLLLALWQGQGRVLTLLLETP